MNSLDTCNVCGKPIDRVLFPRAVSCSNNCRTKKCYNKKRNISVEKECVVCGATFNLTERYGRKKLFCSDKCKAEAHRVYLEEQKFKRAIKVKPLCVCVVCGEGYKSKQAQSIKNRYCSKDCQSRSARRFPHTCPLCGIRFCGLRDAIYCSVQCGGYVGIRLAGQAAKAKADQRRTERALAEKLRIANKRAKLAKGLRLWRSGMTVRDVAMACGYHESGGTSFLNESKAYRRATQKRLSCSQWHNVESGHNAKSKQFSSEKSFSDYTAHEMRKVFEIVKTECQLLGSRRRIDMIVESGLFRFGVELKTTCRTARLDQLLGQALVKCATLGTIPVCIIPDDLQMDSVFKRGCKSLGVIAGTLSEAMQCMIEASGKQLDVSGSLLESRPKHLTD